MFTLDRAICIRLNKFACVYRIFTSQRISHANVVVSSEVGRAKFAPPSPKQITSGSAIQCSAPVFTLQQTSSISGVFDLCQTVWGLSYTHDHD
jgi:hypothetical protein